MNDLSFEVQGIPNQSDLEVNDLEGGTIFNRTLAKKSIVMKKAKSDDEVRPGVRRLITHAVLLRDPGPVIRATAEFFYDEAKENEHRSKRIFVVPSLPKEA
jgi:hypothetical protein